MEKTQVMQLMVVPVALPLLKGGTVVDKTEMMAVMTNVAKPQRKDNVGLLMVQGHAWVPLRVLRGHVRSKCR